MKGAAWWASDQGPLPDIADGHFLPASSHSGRKGKQASWSSGCRPMTSFTLNHFLAPNAITLGVRTSTCESEGERTPFHPEVTESWKSGTCFTFAAISIQTKHI